MDSSRLTYSTRPDTTPEAEWSVERFLLSGFHDSFPMLA